MKPKTMILMVVAVVCGLGASYMTSRLLAERNSEPAEVEKVAVLVAKKNLEQNIALKDKVVQELFEEKFFTKGDADIKDALTSTDQLKDKFLKHSLRKGDFVTPNDIQEEQMAIDLAPGMRAVGLRVTMESSAAGFACTPGSRVDIYSTVRRNTDDDSQTMLLLENVLVLAADTLATKKENAAAMPAGVVTVALNPEDVLRVNIAKEYGALSLSLRRLGDNTKTDFRSLNMSQLLKNKKSGEVAIAPPPAPVVVQELKVETKAETKVETKAETNLQPLPNLKAKPVLEPYVVFMTVGDRTVTKTYFLNEDGNVVLPGSPEFQGSEQPSTPAPGPGPGAGGTKGAGPA